MLLDTKGTSQVKLEMSLGRFLIKTISKPEELAQAFRLRYQVFQVEMIGKSAEGSEDKEDRDEFDPLCDHLAVFDQKTERLIATCRLNSSLFSKKFYSASEFHCQTLLDRPETKLELGRVCVHREFRKSVVIMLIWRALAAYMIETQTKILFGCGSVPTLDPKEAFIVYKFLVDQGKVRKGMEILPCDNFRSEEFERLIESHPAEIDATEKALAEKLLPSLCRSYFDIGCYVPGPPAFDRDFKCIDFLTILHIDDLDPRLRKKMLGDN